MPRNEAKPKSVRKPLRDLSNNNNNNGAGKPSKSINAKNKCSDDDDGGGGRASLDRLLLVHSDLSALLRQIDELVVQALKVKATTKQGSKEIESFTGVLSEMLSTLKPNLFGMSCLQPWVPRFQNVVSSPIKSENQLGPSKPASNENGGKSEFGSPEDLKEDTLISPSPLVSWRANCTIERSRQLFLLTPLPMSKAFSSRHQGTSKLVFERIDFDQTVELPPLLTIPGDANDDLLEGVVAIQPTPRKPSDSITTRTTANTLESGVVTSPPMMLSKRDNSVLVTPCLKMSPPKSCALLEPISESSHRPNGRIRKSTPFPVGIQNCQDSSSSEDSEDLAFKYPELLGIRRQACESGIVKKELDTSPDWLFSPPKSCVLLELLDEKSQENAAVDHDLPTTSSVLVTITSPSDEKENNAHTGCHQRQTSRHPEHVRSNLSFIESTPLWNEPESSFRTSKRPGENTLKKELWTKFEAASNFGIHYNASAFQRTARKGFLDMLEEASCDDEGSLLDGLR